MRRVKNTHSPSLKAALRVVVWFGNAFFVYLIERSVLLISGFRWRGLH